MKTTIFVFLTFFTLTGFAQKPDVTGAPTPPVPGKPQSMQDTTGAAVKNPNETVQAVDKGTIKRAKVFFIEPKDGATVTSPVTIKMGVEGMKIRPAGEAPDEVTSGHHHVVIDGAPVKAGIPLPMDEKNIHYGKGQTEATLALPPGKHKLTLQFADGAHRSFGPRMSQTITVTVK